MAEPNAIEPADGQALLKLARQTAEARINGQPLPPPLDIDRPPFNELRGLFVTYHVAGRLRGCIGTFQPDRPLGRLVQEMALRALRDPRFFFNPIRPDELPRLQVEISILSPMRRSRDPLAEFNVGVHGILIHCNGRGGCFLPQVALETGWDAQQMLANCCQHKAGLDADAWRSPDAEVYLFTAQVFSEAERVA